jgi:hypothetical protein
MSAFSVPYVTCHPSLHLQSIRFRKIELFITYVNRGEFMHYIGKSKISTLHSKPDISYPLIRLLQQYKHLIGKTAQFFITNHESKKHFLFFSKKQKMSAKL